MKEPLLSELAKKFSVIKGQLVKIYYHRCHHAFAEIQLVIDTNRISDFRDADRWTLPYHQGSQIIYETVVPISERIQMRFVVYSDHADALDGLVAVLGEIFSLLRRVPRKFLPNLIPADWKFDGKNYALSSWLLKLLGFHWQCDLDWRYPPEFLPATISSYSPEENPPTNGVDQIAGFDPRSWFILPHEVSEAIEIAREKAAQSRDISPAALIVSFSEDVLTMSLDAIDHLARLTREKSAIEVSKGDFYQNGNSRRADTSRHLTEKQAAALAIDMFFNPKNNPDYFNARPSQSELGKAVGRSQKDINIGLKELLPPLNVTAAKKFKRYLDQKMFDELLAIAHKELRVVGILRDYSETHGMCGLQLNIDPDSVVQEQENAAPFEIDDIDVSGFLSILKKRNILPSIQKFLEQNGVTSIEHCA